ncbi:MAG: phage tail assembly chaperone [Sphingobium sp.]|nr:phage tail assembly chaperone [Sphingobium sp.]
MNFAEGARRLAGQAGLLLGWRPDEFWRATPDELETALAALAAMIPESAAPPDPATLARLKEMHPDG